VDSLNDMKSNQTLILAIITLSTVSFQSYSQVKSYGEYNNTLSLKVSAKSKTIFFEKDNLQHLNTYRHLTNDSLKKGCCGCIGVYGVKFILGFDSRHSLVVGQLVKMHGLKVGMEISDYETIRLGFGIYWLNDPVKLGPFVESGDTAFAYIDFDYSTLFVEYVIYQDFRWEVSVPFNIGLGTGSVKFEWPKYDFDTTMVIKGIPVMATNIAAHYKVFPWMGIGAGLGYRQILSLNKQIRKAFNSPFYVIKIKLFLGGLYKSVFKHNEVIEEREEYKRQREEKRNDKRRGQSKD